MAATHQRKVLFEVGQTIADLAMLTVRTPLGRSEDSVRQWALLVRKTRAGYLRREFCVVSAEQLQASL